MFYKNVYLYYLEYYLSNTLHWIKIIKKYYSILYKYTYLYNGCYFQIVTRKSLFLKSKN